jgi:PST family polysaccharide transporter
LIAFGAGVSLKNAINYCASNVDYFIVGKFMSATLLGLYTRAYQLVTLPLTKFAAPLSMVTFPAYSEIQGDLPRLERAYLRVVMATVLLSFPVLTGFMVAGEYLIVGLFGDNWRAATPAFRILCLAAMLKSVFHLAGAVVEATGQVYAEVIRQSIYLLLLLAGCLIAATHGIEAIAVAVALSSFWLYLAMSQLVIRILNSDWQRFLQAHIPGLAVSAVVALASIPLALAAQRWSELPESLVLGVLIFVSAGAFLAGLLFLPERLLGDMRPWIMAHYGKHIPARLRSWLARNSQPPSASDSTHE